MFGIDEEGKAFVSMPLPDSGGSIFDGILDNNEAERRYISCLKCIETVHRNNIHLGDITDKTFSIDKQGNMLLIGVMGEVESTKEFIEINNFKTNESLIYLAPEQLLGLPSDAKSDVFSVGVLGFKFLYGDYPYDLAQKNNEKLEHINFRDLKDITNLHRASNLEKDNLPIWCQEVFAKALQDQSAFRYRNVSSLLSSIYDIRQSAIQQLTNHEKKVNKQSESYTFDPNVQKKKQSNNNKKIFYLVSGVSIIASIIIVTGYYLFKGLFSTSTLNTSNSSLNSGFNGQNSDPDEIQSETDPGMSFSELKATVDELEASIDPLVFSKYKQLILTSRNEIDQKLILGSFKNKLIKDSQPELANSIELILKDLETDPNNLQMRVGLNFQQYINVLLNLINKGLPISERVDALDILLGSENLRIYRASVIKTLLLIVSDSMETSSLFEINSFAKGVKRYLFATDDEKIANLNNIESEIIDLFLLSPEADKEFAELLLKKEGLDKKLTDNQLLMTYFVLTKTNNENADKIFEVCKLKGLITGDREKILDLINMGESIPYDVQIALEDIFLNRVNKSDVNAITSWFDGRSSEILLALLNQNITDDLKNEVLESIYSKEHKNTGLNNLVKLIKRDFWNDRALFLKLIILIVSNKNSDKNLLENEKITIEKDYDLALEAVSKIEDKSKIILTLLEIDDINLVKSIIRNFKQKLGLRELMPLLESKNKEVKIAAIKALSGYNDAIALNIIYRAYEKEKDPEIQKVYKETFWNLTQR